MSGLDETVRDSRPASNDARTLAVGSKIGRFTVVGVLGAGGAGVVYSAHDPELDRKVAIKLLRTEGADAEGRARMLREAQAMAKIDHPNVIKVHEVGTHETGVFVAMELAEGGTLGAWLAAKPRSKREIVDVFKQAGRGLAAAHAVGLIHRDFKPDNVLLTKAGVARVTDFGLVSRQDETAAAPPTSRDSPLALQLTRTGALMGTPAYMAPEQFKGEAITARTDQFSFFVALAEALYGMRPFPGATFEEILESVTGGKLVFPAHAVEVPRRLRQVLGTGSRAIPRGDFRRWTPPSPSSSTRGDGACIRRG